MSLVALVSMKSKDRNTHHGAVIVGQDNEIRSTGYNSFVRGLDDNVEARQERPEKYFFFEHAERNAIYNAALCGIKLKGCRMFASGIPCADCARGIIQSGIVEVIAFIRGSEHNVDLWNEHTKRTIEMFNETGVKLRYYDEELIDEIYLLTNGVKIK